MIFMLLTKECDYAVRIVRCLADMEIKTVKEICAEENVPLPFAYRIMKKLENVKIVMSYRGPAGGYRLMKYPNAITLYNIISAVDGRLLLIECQRKDVRCANNKIGKKCKIHAEFNRIQTILIKSLGEKKLSELV